MTTHYNYLTKIFTFNADDCSTYENDDRIFIYDGELRTSYMSKLMDADTFF